MTVKKIAISDEVAVVLRRATVDGDKLFLNGQIGRELYVKVDKVLSALGGKWNRNAKAHLFESPAGCRTAMSTYDLIDHIEGALSERGVVDKKQTFQSFNSPPAVVDRLIDAAEVTTEHLVLEPSAGNGAILQEIMHAASVCFCEIQSELVNEINKKEPEAMFVGADFLQYNPGPIYDRIVANPPFSNQQDIDHVSHMIDCLKPGGILVSVMSPGITFRTDNKNKAFMEKIEGTEWAVMSFPADSFKASGTKVSAVMIAIQKRGANGR